METLILLKANLKKKKSAFISVAILMIIVTAFMTAILSTTDNYRIGFEKAYETAENGDAVVSIISEYLTDELKEKIESSSIVKKVSYHNALAVYGSSCGKTHDGNSSFLQKMRGGIYLYDSGLKSFTSDTPKLEKGEIYVPLGLKSKLSCNIGDTITYTTIEGTADFVIKGFVQEPSFGAQTIGWKQIFISDEDFDYFYNRWKPLEDTKVVDFTMVSVYKADDCNFRSGKFLRELNLETKIADMALGAMTREQTERYSMLLPDILTKLFTIFVMFLFIIVLILVSHSISTEIESDYVSFGILKSQGFSRKKLTKLFFIQYLSAELLGIVIGTVLSLPLESTLTESCQLITGIMPNRGLSVGKSLAMIGIILLVSAALIFIKTLPLGKISPVKAIGGGKEDIYFDSRIKLPISKTLLSASLAVRQFTSAKRRYIGAVMISAILVFFMLTVNMIINYLTSKNALQAMGTEFTDITVYFQRETAEKYMDEVKDLVTSLTEVKEIYCSDSLYLSMNGENLFTHIVKEPEKLSPILKGRAPIYDNETVITEMIADTLEIGVGDEVTISYRENEETYIISGIYQTVNDSGMCFAMSEKAINKIYPEFIIRNIGFLLDDSDPNALSAEELKDIIKEQYRDIDGVGVEKFDIDSFIGAEVLDMIKLMRAAIYIFSAIFALVAVRMVCTKAFLQERTDIGVYKALGYTVNRLRLGFGLRFLTVAVIGTVLGVIASLLLSSKTLGLGLSMIGLSRLPTTIDFVSVAVPSVLLITCFFVFAYLSSGKIKKVAVRELVTE
ncbi:MAG: FtsX-like permease family protein [Ruminococcaceae bacterium]|nr:FtsX-like permease family protein [Oscillospiraceae bacterium]